MIEGKQVVVRRVGTERVNDICMGFTMLCNDSKRKDGSMAEESEKSLKRTVCQVKIGRNGSVIYRASLELPSLQVILCIRIALN